MVEDSRKRKEERTALSSRTPMLRCSMEECDSVARRFMPTERPAAGPRSASAQRALSERSANTRKNMSDAA
ncbi:unnamed protein product [Lota lota]